MKIRSSMFLVLVTCSGASSAFEVTKEMCIESLEKLGIDTSDYELKKGWGGTKHFFSSSTECYERKSSIYIKSEGRIYAEDGFFGLDALDARDQIRKSNREDSKLLKRALNDKIDNLRDEYDLAIKELNDRTEGLLKQVRENNIPDSIKEGIIAGREKEELAKLEADKRRAEKKAEKERRNQERQAEKERRNQEREAEKARKLAAKEEEEAEDKRKGFHCLSGWNGSQREVVSRIKSVLNDPKSFEHVETLVAPVVNGRHTFKMTYRAKNGFGGLILGEASGSYANSNCSDVKLTKLQ
jgi:hypothetical protein